jgi:hypothetical protein
VRIKITGSRVHRVWKCPPSAILPQIESDEPRPYADRGRDIHRFLERVGQGVSLGDAIAECPAELRTLLECLDLANLPTHLATEVAFAYDYKARTARELGRNIGRDYAGHLERTGQAPIGPTEIACTVDLAGLEGRRGYVGDYKTGHTRYPSPDRFGQTLLGALCVRHAWKCDDVIAELIYIRSDGNHYPARRLLDEWDLDIFADEIEAALELVDYSEAEYIAGRGVPVREGDQCDYCPAFKQCPAKVALVKSIPAELAALGYTREVIVGEEAPAVGTVAAGALDRRRAPEIWLTLERLEEIIGRIKQEICGLAAFDPIDLPDGRVIGRLITRREGLDGKIAAAVIEQWFGAEAREAAVELSVSKERLREAAADHVRKVKADAEAKGEKAPKLAIQSKSGDGVLDRALAEIRRRGGIEETIHDSIKPHVPKRKSLNP